MTLDSSALIAILFGEPGYLDLVDRVLGADIVRIGTPTLTETAIVLTARRREPFSLPDRAESTRIARPSAAGEPFARQGKVRTARGRSGDELAILLDELDVSVVPFTVAHHEVASRAYQRYGRGRHKANLNFGDCLSYAVASLAGDTLLFVGDDFRRTDIDAA